VHGSRFQIQDPPPAGQDPAHQIRQPLAKIRRQLGTFFVLGPQRIGSKNTVFGLVRTISEQ
jgi:hypothetical protein